MWFRPESIFLFGFWFLYRTETKIEVLVIHNFFFFFKLYNRGHTNVLKGIRPCGSRMIWEKKLEVERPVLNTMVTTKMSTNTVSGTQTVAKRTGKFLHCYFIILKAKRIHSCVCIMSFWRVVEFWNWGEISKYLFVCCFVFSWIKKKEELHCNMFIEVPELFLYLEGALKYISAKFIKILSIFNTNCSI